MIRIRKATRDDLNAIKELADSEIKTLGFTIRSAIEEGINLGYVFVAEADGQIIGFQQYYHRKKDLQTTLYRKMVSENFRHKGVARKLVDAVVKESKELGRSVLVLKCPFDNESNEFHKAYGFVLARVEPGKRRKLNVYEYQIDQG
jgi:N-acetylglutamate synthase-like GNAT family acetyltransferase